MEYVLIMFPLDRERINSLESERIVERERQWNQPHSTLSHSTSNLSPHLHPERPRTHSHPTRPDSERSHSSPNHPLHYRTHSFSSSGTSSPGGSLISHESVKEHEQEIQHELEHGRERNWNAPHPKWDVHAGHHGRPVSPMPPLAHSASSSSIHSHSHSHSQVRAESLHTPSAKDLTALHANARKSPGHPNHTSVKSPRMPHSVGKEKSPGLHRVTGFPARPNSPLPPPPRTSAENGSPGKSPASGSRFGWQFPRSRTPLPPLELDQVSPERAPPSHVSHLRTLSSPTPGSTSKPIRSLASHIPVKSPKKFHDVMSTDTDTQESDDKLGNEHKRTTDESNAITERSPQDDLSSAVPESYSHKDDILREHSKEYPLTEYNPWFNSKRRRITATG